MKVICKGCGSIDSTEEKEKGSGWITFILVFVYIIPAIIYSIWRSSTKYKVCSSCNPREIVPIMSPVGRKIYKEYYK